MGLNSEYYNTVCINSWHWGLAIEYPSKESLGVLERVKREREQGSKVSTVIPTALCS